jgi:hypothetical protein
MPFLFLTLQFGREGGVKLGHRLGFGCFGWRVITEITGMVRYVLMALLLACHYVQSALIQSASIASALQRALRPEDGRCSWHRLRLSSMLTGAQGKLCGACAQNSHWVGCKCAMCGLATWRA